MRSGRIDHTRTICTLRAQCVDHGHSIASSIVVQTQNDRIGLGKQGFFCFWVFAALVRDAQSLDRGHVCQPLTNLQSGGASLAVDEYLDHEMCLLFMRQCAYLSLKRVTLTQVLRYSA